MTEANRMKDVPAADPAVGVVRDLFHCCAVAAFVAEARAVQGWPESEPVRRRAYTLYEHHLAAERAARVTSPPDLTVGPDAC